MSRVERHTRKRGIVTLSAISIAVAAIWLVVLPRVAERPAMRAHLQWLEDKRIDPSAMYYTELEVMEEILQRHRSSR